jgi:uncharacterized protein (DUF362 family)
MRSDYTECRRNFLKTTVAGGVAAVVASRWASRAFAQTAAAGAAPATAEAAARSKVALTNGGTRGDNIIKALTAIEKDIKAAIGNRRVVIKPNNVVATNQLAATHVDALAAILDFLKAIGKLEGAVIAESGTAPTMQGFSNYKYTTLPDKYPVKLMDLDQEKFYTVMAFDQSVATPKPVRMSSVLADQEHNFIISTCMPKTHNFAVCTMGIKNIILGAGMKFARSGGGRGGMMSDKSTLHGGGAHGININLSMLAPMLHPSMTLIDGYEGMEGDGPISGPKVDHKVCVASLDYLAADVVGAKLMGLELGDVGYLTYLAAANAGESDISKMEIIGEAPDKLAKKYKLSPSAQAQLSWRNPASVQPRQ